MSPRIHLLTALLVLGAPAFGAAQPPGAKAPAAGTDQYGDPLPKGAVARLGTGRLCQLDVWYMAFSPDGTRLATVAKQSARLQVWDVATGKEIRRWPIPKGHYYSLDLSGLAFSPDGTRLALACADKCVRVWDVATAKELLKQQLGFLTAVAFAPDGKTLAVSSGMQVHLLNAQTGQPGTRLDAPGRVEQVAFAPDGKSIVAAGSLKPDRKETWFCRWAADTGKEQSKKVVEVSSSYVGKLSPDGRFFARPEESGEVIRRWDTTTGKELPPSAGKASYPAFLAFAGDGNTLTATTRDGKYRVWDSLTGKLLHEFAGPEKEWNRVALSGNGKIVAASNNIRHEIHLWDVEKEKPLHQFAGHRSGPVVVTIAADGKTAWSTTRDGGYSVPPRPGASWSVRHWDYQTGKELHAWRQDQETEVRYAVFSPGGKFLAVATIGGLMRLFDPAKDKQTLAWPLPTQTFTMNSGAVVPKKYECLSVLGLEFSPDGATIATLDQATMQLWDTTNGKEVRQFTIPFKLAVHYCYFPDGQSLLVAGGTSGGKYVLVQLDVKTGKQICSFPGVSKLVNYLAVSRGGYTVATTMSGTVRAHEVLTREPRFSVDTGSPVDAVTFSPDNALLVTGQRDGTLKLWNALTGQAIEQLGGHEDIISSLAFSPDGRWLLSGGGNVALVWDVQAIVKQKSPAPEKLSPAGLEKIWQGLSNKNPSEAGAVVERLLRSGKAGVTFVHKRLTQPSSPAIGKIAQWVADLDSDQFAVREKASEQLEKLGSLAAPALEKALAQAPSAESEARLQKLLAKLGGPPDFWLQQHRAVEALEMMGDDAARQALKSLATEASEEWLRSTAQQALQRLQQLSPSPK